MKHISKYENWKAEIGISENVIEVIGMGVNLGIMFVLGFTGMAGYSLVKELYKTKDFRYIVSRVEEILNKYSDEQTLKIMSDVRESNIAEKSVELKNYIMSRIGESSESDFTELSRLFKEIEDRVEIMRKKGRKNI